jgi:WD40 repeat protein
LGAIQEGGVVSYRFDPLEINTQYDVSEPQRILALSPDGATLALTADNTTIELVDPASGENRLSIPMGTPINSASFSPDGSVLAISSADVWQVSLVDPASGQLTATLTGFETAAPIYNAVFLGSSQKLVWFARARVQVQDIPSQALGPALEHEDFINGLALTTAGDLLVTLTSKSMNDSSSPVVQFWDPQTGADLGIYVLDTSGTAVAFSPDGQVLAVGAGADILLIDPVNRTLLATLAGEEGTSVTTLAFSPDGTALASTLDAGQLSIWRVQP